MNRIFLPYEESVQYTAAPYRSKCVVSGNPVRENFFSGDPVKGRKFVGAPDDLPLLLVMEEAWGRSS